MKKVVFVALAGFVLGPLVAGWTPAVAQDPLPAGILGCVWKNGGVYAAPPGTTVYAKNVSTGVVYCTQATTQQGGCTGALSFCVDPQWKYASYVLNNNYECTGIADALRKL